MNDATKQKTTAEAGEVRAEGTDNAQLEKLRADLEAARDRALRSQAELENYRKRAAREIEEHRRYAELPLMRDLLPVLDNVERAIAAADKSQDVAVLLDGMKLVAREFEDALGTPPLQADRGLALALRSALAPRDFANAQQRIPAEYRADRGTTGL